MPGVSISAGYGCGGTLVAPEVARQLQFTFLDRTISSDVAERLRVSVQDAEGAEIRRSTMEKFFAVLAPLAGGAVGTDTTSASGDDALLNEIEAFRAEAEGIIRHAIAGGAVILGRGASAALRDEPDVLRVRLFGDKERRIAQAARIEGVDEATARRRQSEVDAARRRYVRRLYRIDIDQSDCFHLHLDSTALPTAACVEVIVTAYRALTASG